MARPKHHLPKPPKPHKPPQPPKPIPLDPLDFGNEAPSALANHTLVYDGRPHDTTFYNWATSINFAIKHTQTANGLKVPSSIALKWTASWLAGDAAMWWFTISFRPELDDEGKVVATNINLPTTYQELLTELALRFMGRDLPHPEGELFESELTDHTQWRTKLPLRCPPKWRGEFKNFALEMWAWKCQMYVDLRGAMWGNIYDAVMTGRYAAKLTGGPKVKPAQFDKWMEALKQTYRGSLQGPITATPRNWVFFLWELKNTGMQTKNGSQTFVEQMVYIALDVRGMQHIREEYEALKEENSGVLGFVSKLDLYVKFLVPRPNEYEVMRRFRSGVKEDLRAKVRDGQPAWYWSWRMVRERNRFMIDPTRAR